MSWKERTGEVVGPNPLRRRPPHRPPSPVPASPGVVRQWIAEARRPLEESAPEEPHLTTCRYPCGLTGTASSRIKRSLRATVSQHVGPSTDLRSPERRRCSTNLCNRAPVPGESRPAGERHPETAPVGKGPGSSDHRPRCTDNPGGEGTRPLPTHLGRRAYAAAVKQSPPRPTSQLGTSRGPTAQGSRRRQEPLPREALVSSAVCTPYEAKFHIDPESPPIH